MAFTLTGYDYSWSGKNKPDIDDFFELHFSSNNAYLVLTIPVYRKDIPEMLNFLTAIKEGATTHYKNILSFSYDIMTHHPSFLTFSISSNMQKFGKLMAKLREIY